MKDPAENFRRALRQRAWAWRSGEMLAALLRWGAQALVVLMIYAGLDALLAFSESARLVLNTLLVGGLLFTLSWKGLTAMGRPTREMARRADRLLGLPRQPVLSAHELLRSPPTPGGSLQSFLLRDTLRQGTENLETLPVAACIPSTLIRRQSAWLGLAALGLALVYLSQPILLSTLLARIRHPGADIPPYSRLAFHVQPGAPRVLYGGNLELQVRIDGGPVNAPVFLLTRNGDHEERSSCFREGDAAWSQRLENVVDPVEFCFATGRARSPWHQVKVRLQPRISRLRLRILPPAYTHLPEREQSPGREGIQGYPGSTVRLELTSNRPLASGQALQRPRDGISPPVAVTGRKNGVHTLVFEWQMQHTADVEVTLRDIQGTPLAKPLQLAQKILEDSPPRVGFDRPAPFALATPSSVVPLTGAASDDLGLRQVQLVRTLVGFRDRMKPLGPELPEKRFTYSDQLNLQKLGVLPGQILELYLEARDFNPSLMGIGVSDIVRLEIINETEYGEMLRSRETLDQFLARFQAAQKALQNYREAIEDLDRALDNPSTDPTEVRRLLDQARRANEAARDLAARLAGDFPAYDLEQELETEMLGWMRDMEFDQRRLAETSAQDPGLRDLVDRIQSGFPARQQAMEQHLARAEEAAAIGRVMEQAARFRNLVQRQRDLVRQLRRYEFPSATDLDKLAYFGTQQREILAELDGFLATLPPAADELSAFPEMESLRRDALEFADQVRESGAREDLERAVTAAGNSDGPGTYQAARQGLDKLEELLRPDPPGDNGFAGLCRGGMKFSVRDELRQTLSQMLQNLMQGRGMGGHREGNGMGAGMGGDANDGFSMSAHTRFNTPVFGPPRSVFLPGGNARGGSGSGSGGPASMEVEEAANPLQPSAHPPADTRSLPGTRPPDKYREALKRYFQLNESSP